MKNYIEWVLKYRTAVIAFTLLITVLAVLQARSIKIIIDPSTMMPQSHPFVSTSTQVEHVFGSKHVVVIGITPKEGDIYQQAVLEKVQKISAAFLKVPGVVKENLLSLSAKRAKNITGKAEGLEVHPLMATIPTNSTQMSALRMAVEKNPVYLNTIVSKDSKTTAIIVEFKDEPGGFKNMMSKVEPIVERERDSLVDINVGGLPNFLARIEIYSERMAVFLPIAFLVLCLVLFEAFRSKQGFILPLVTAVLAVAWSVGVMGVAGISMDAFNATTPILILAVATGHSVQLLKRYYEEYYRLRETMVMSQKDANREAVVISISRVGPVMIVAGAVASLGFFSLMIFDISTVRTFGIFTGFGILAALILEMTFIPALRSILSPPKDRTVMSQQKVRVWGRITGGISNLVTGKNRGMVYSGITIFIVVALIGMTRIIEDNSVKKYFSSDESFQKDDKALNQNMGGTNTMYILIEGKKDDAIKNPKTLQAIDELQHFLEDQPKVGKTISISDFIKRMNQAMHGDDQNYYKIPESEQLVSQYLLLYSMSGDPGDFDSYVDYGYRMAKLTVFVKTDSTAYIEQLINKVNAFSATHFSDDVHVRIGGSAPQDAALNEAMVKGKILNIVQIAAVVFVISSFIFRSVVAGVLVLLPLLIAVIANFGLMGWSGILLNIPTSLTSAMAVGIGADYAIYLIYRLREELASELSEEVAVRKVLGSAGEAILFVAFAVAAGYGVLIFSFGFNVHIWLGILIATAMIVSALSALLLIPALVLTFRPNFIYAHGDAGNRNLAPVAVGILLFAIGLGVQSPPVQAAELDLLPIMTKNFIVSKVLDSTSDATFTLINKSGQERVRKVLGATKLVENGIDNMRMTRFMSPPDIKGTVSLLIEHSDREDDIWIYLPALKKVRRLVSSNKKDSFIGTDFSYADVIGYKVEEWNYKLVSEEVINEQPCFVVESTPKTESVKSNTGYSKRVSWIRKDNKLTVKSEFWDEAGEMLKMATFSDIQLVDPKRDKWQAMRLETSNVQTGHRTVILFENFKVNQKVKAELFTTSYMERE